MAHIVPIGIDFCASAKSPLLFDPAMIPVTDGKNIPTRIVNVVVMSIMTWLYTFFVVVPLANAVVLGRTSSSLNERARIWSCNYELRRIDSCNFMS